MIEFVPNGNFFARSTASDETFDDINLTDRDWAGYDESGVRIIFKVVIIIGCISRSL